MSTLAMTERFNVGAAAATLGERHWRIAAVAMLSVRCIQGFIYWGGGSRRFIYAPAKLDPTQPSWMANKFQTAMPGALLGMDHVIGFMLQHFWLLYAGVILFSAAELIVGLALMAGLMTRLAALVSMLFSVVLMLMFGWQGATCIDEWTMAAANLAMGATLMLAGSGAWSLDNVLLRRRPALAGRSWFRWAGGSLPLPLGDTAFAAAGLAVLAAVLAFDVSTYSYYRGSVIGPFHSGPVSPTRHHLTVSDAALLADGGVRFHVYLDAGTPEAPAHVMQAQLLAADGRTLAAWSTEALSKLPPAAFNNDFAYNRFKAAAFGIAAGMGAAATITLPPADAAAAVSGATTLKLIDVEGHSFIGKLAASGG